MTAGEYVLVGGFDLSAWGSEDYGWTPSVHKVREGWGHPEYTAEGGHHDYALVQLETPVRLEPRHWTFASRRRPCARRIARNTSSPAVTSSRRSRRGARRHSSPS